LEENPQAVIFEEENHPEIHVRICWVREITPVSNPTKSVNLMRWPPFNVITNWNPDSESKEEGNPLIIGEIFAHLLSDLVGESSLNHVE